MDASARTRLLNVLVAAVFVGLIIWRPIIAWALLCVAYISRAIERELKFPAARFASCAS
jgi:hypothetical protein